MNSRFTSSRSGFLFLLLLAAFSFDRCSDKCQVKSQYYSYVPVYSTSAEIKAATGMTEARDVHSMGRLYVKDGYLFVNEVGQGIHIFDNRNPATPVAVGFLNIPGNLDLAIQGKTLYADSYVDLVAFDITDIHHISEVKRIEGLFTSYNSYGYGVDPVLGVITSWNLKPNAMVIQDECESQLQSWGGIYDKGGIAMLASSSAMQSTMSAIPSSTPGIAGSTARFAIMDSFLYALDGTRLQALNITSEKNPIASESINVAWDAETLFPHDKNLFIGARAGMYIFDVTTAGQPKLLSQYDHIMSCDPVVVEGDYAYVTLYEGGLCHVSTNQLEVIDIKNLSAPQLVATYPLTNPHGLGIDRGTLFICDGSDGLKVFDASNPLTISDNVLAHYGSIHALDVIPFHDLAIMIGSDGIYQYDYSDVGNIKLISQIPIVAE